MSDKNYKATRLKKMCKILVLLVPLLLVSSCTLTSYQSRTEVYNMVRMPQVNDVDCGIPQKKNEFKISAQFQQSLSEPQSFMREDSSTKTTEHDGIFFDTRTTTTTETQSHTFEKQSLVSGNVQYAFTDRFGIGGSFIRSIDQNTAVGNHDNNIYLKNNLSEATFFLRLYGRRDRVSVAYRPELTAGKIFFDKKVLIRDTITETEQSFKYYIAFKHSLVTSFIPYENIRLFIGLHNKFYPFTIIEDDLKSEASAAIYWGMGFQPFSFLHIAPHIILPLGSLHSEHRSPMQAAIKTSFTLFGDS